MELRFVISVVELVRVQSLVEIGAVLTILVPRWSPPPPPPLGREELPTSHAGFRDEACEATHRDFCFRMLVFMIELLSQARARVRSREAPGTQ